MISFASASFTKNPQQLKMKGSEGAVRRHSIGARNPAGIRRIERRSMSTTGELIRMINYVDDMVTTLRRIRATVPFMTEEERKRLAERLRKFQPTIDDVVQELEKSDSR
jgi:hypothetical protein